MKTIAVEGTVYDVPDWVKWVAQEPEGEYTGYDVPRLWKLSGCFWKAQGQYEGFDICAGAAYAEPEYGDPGRVWPVEHFTPNAPSSADRAPEAKPDE